MLHDENGARFGTVTGIGFDRRPRLSRPGWRSEGRFQIFGINVEAGGSDDDILLAAAEMEIAGRIK